MGGEIMDLEHNLEKFYYQYNQNVEFVKQDNYWLGDGKKIVGWNNSLMGFVGQISRPETTRDRRTLERFFV